MGRSGCNSARCNRRNRRARNGPCQRIRIHSFATRVIDNGPAPQQKASLFDHLVGEREQRRRHGKSERSCRLQVDHELELGRPDHRQIGWFFALEDATDIDADLAILLRKVCPVAHQSADIGKHAIEIDRRQAVMCREDQELRTPRGEQRIGTDEESVGPFLHEARKDCVNVAVAAGGEDLDLAPNGQSRRLHVSSQGFGVRIFGIDEHGKSLELRYQFVHEADLLCGNSPVMKLTPVVLPPGRLRLIARPACTGSPEAMKTMGMVAVAALATRVAAMPPGVAMTVTRRRTRSAAKSGSRSRSLYAQRNSIATLRPSM